MTLWNVDVEFARQPQYDVIRRSIRTAAANCQATFIEHLDSGETIVRVGVEARNLRTAVDKALQRLEAALRANDVSSPSIAVRARPLGQADHLTAIAGLAEVAHILGVSRQRASQLTRRGDFPEPIARLAMGPVYRRSSIERYRRQRAAVPPDRLFPAAGTSVDPTVQHVADPPLPHHEASAE